MAVNINSGGQPLQWVADLNDDPMTAAVKRIENKFKDLGDTVQRQAGTMDSLVQKATSAIAAYATFTSGAAFVKDIARVRGEFQQLETSFRVMLGSKEKADQLLAQGVTLAAKTPFTLAEVGQGAKQLLAYGFAAENVTDSLTTLGNIASGVGAPLNDIVYLYGTLRSTGRATNIDLQQFAGRGIPIYEALSKTLNITATETKSVALQIRELASAGKINFEDVEKAFKSLTATGGQFFNLMEEQSKTLTGLTSNLEDAWQRMLNEIGKSNEGLFSNAIKGATALIDNYKEVIKILQIIAVAYGTYRAALALTNIAAATLGTTTGALTATQILQAGASGIAQRAMALLNTTMLANPAVAIATGITALVAALYIFRTEAIKAKSSSELLGDAQKRVSDSLADQESKIKVYTETLKQGNLSEKQRAEIYDKLNKISPTLVNGLNAQNISYAKLTGNLKLYLDQLRQRLTLEANTEAVTASIRQEQAIREKVEEAQKSVDKFRELLKGTDPKQLALAGVSTLTQAKLQLQAQVGLLDDLNKQLNNQQKTTEEITKRGIAKTKEAEKATTAAKPKTNRELIAETSSLEVLAALRTRIQEEYEKSNDASQRRILAADLAYADKRRKALDVYSTVKQGAKDIEKAESDINSMLEKRKGILEDLESIKRDAKQTGLLKEQSEIDKVNQKYDEAIAKIEEYNLKAQEFNKKSTGSKVAAIGLTDIAELNKARLQEVTNVSLKADAENYKQHLERQADVFAQFEEAKKDIGVTAAADMYAEQTQGFETYVKFLEAEATKILPKVFAGTANIGDQQKLLEIGKARNEAIDAQNKASFERQKAEYVDLLEASKTFQIQRGEVERKFNTLFTTLATQRGRISEEEFSERLEALQDSKQEELDIIANNELEKTDVYKKFQEGFQDLGVKATKGVLAGLKNLREEMKNNAAVVAVLDKAIKQTEETLSKQTVETFQAVASTIKELFGNISINISGNYKVELAKIADTISQVGTLFDQNASDSAKTTSWIGLIVAGAKELDKYSHRKDTNAFQAEIDALAALNLNTEVANLALERYLKKFEKLSGAQKIQAGLTYFDEITKQANQAFDALKKFDLKVIVSNKLVEGRGFFVADQLKPVFQDIDTSALNSLEDYQKLLEEIKKNANQIRTTVITPDGRSHSIFAPVADEDLKLLQKLVDNYAQFAEAQEAFKKQLDETFTGTTASSITDSIVNGFKNGLRSAADFAQTFEDLMKNALFQSLKMQALEVPLKKFFEEFASATQSDTMLTDDEIKKLKDNFTGIITDAGKKFEELQKITGINANSTVTGQANNSLMGGVKSLTEETGTVIAGQFGAMRLTAGEQLNISMQQLNVLNAIQANTAWIHTQYQLWQRIELNGLKIKQ